MSKSIKEKIGKLSVEDKEKFINVFKEVTKNPLWCAGYDINGEVGDGCSFCLTDIGNKGPTEMEKALEVLYGDMFVDKTNWYEGYLN